MSACEPSIVPVLCIIALVLVSGVMAWEIQRRDRNGCQH